MIIGIDASKAAFEKRTGVENFVYQVILNLAKIDHKNTYFLYSNKKLPQELLTSKNFQEKFIPFPKFWSRLRLPFAIAHDHPDAYFQPAYLIPLAAPAKSVGVVHDLAWRFYPKAYSKKEIFLQKEVLANLKKRARKIICVSKSCQKDLLEVEPTLEDRIETVPLSGNDNYTKIIEPKDVLHLNSKYFLSIGRLEERKNTARIVEAFVEAKRKSGFPHKLVLAGKPGTGYENIQKIIDSNPDSAKDIIFPGYIDESDLNDLLSGAEALVYPSLYEGFGITALEAMAAGTPVITSNISSLPEVAGDSALLVNPESLDEISAAMIKIYEDAKYRSLLVQRGLARAKEFNWQNTATQILNILEEL